MENTPQRRKRIGPPPTALMAHYREMPAKERRKLQLFGGVLLTFSIVFPMVLVIWVTPPLPFWILDLAAFLAGVLFVWPPGAIALAEMVPEVARKLIPSTRLSALLERLPEREPDCSPEEDAPDEL